MVIGKITDVNQDIVFVEVRTETGDSHETYSGGNPGSQLIQTIGTVGEGFTAEHYFDRIKIELPPGNLLIVRLYNNHDRIIMYHESHIPERSGYAIVHFAFDPMPAGDYYWELKDLGAGNSYCSYYTGSTISRGFIDGVSVPGDFKSKIMYVSDDIQLKPVAVEGDKVETTHDITSGSDVMKIQTGVIVDNIARQGDTVNTTDKILTGCWYATEDLTHS